MSPNTGNTQAQQFFAGVLKLADMWDVLPIPDYTKVSISNWRFVDGQPVGQPGLVTASRQAQKRGTVVFDGCSMKFGSNTVEAAGKVILWARGQLEALESG